MAIKNILVAYNGGPASDAALKLAIQLANKHEAHLTGIMAHGVSSATKLMPSWLGASMRKSIEESFLQRLSEVSHKFRTVVGTGLPADRCHWLDVQGDPDHGVSVYARAFDLTVVGQYENLPEADAVALHPDRIAFESNRPIIVVPKAFEATEPPQSVAVAWNGSRTAARAMLDAMPILESKEHVSVITVGQDVADRIPAALNVVELLQRHDIDAKQVVLPAKGASAAKTILDYCVANDLGLLVSGAYQNAKLREDLMGGFTNELLTNADLPILVSH